MGDRFTWTNALAVVLVVLVVLYVGWKGTQSPSLALQFAFNGLSVGAVYALLALGFTVVYSTVWFFDLYYGAAAAVGAYGVLYLRSQDVASFYDPSSTYLNAVFALIAAGVAAWGLHEALHDRLRSRLGDMAPLAIEAAAGIGVGAYIWYVLANPDSLHVLLSPAVGVFAALFLTWAPGRLLRRRAAYAAAAPVAVAAGAYLGYVTYLTPASNLYLSWVVSCLLAGAVGVALYRGLYVYMRQRARSPLIMLVASLGVLLAISAAITIVFGSAGRPLPNAFGSDPWTIAGANIKGFNVFTVGVAFAAFLGLVAFLKFTAFGKMVRAIGDDEEVSKVVGINTTYVITIVFFIGAVLAALAGLLSGHDTAVQPRMGLLLLLKGWIASVVGGIGNLYGALLGGFVLGMVEQFGIWDLAGEWKDGIAIVLLIMFLSFWPTGLIPRK